VADAPSPGRIRDPVHGYIAYTAIERALLDHPVAQRLRHVEQSAAAHLVFPEMRVSRLAHSLGAMHMASRFLEATLSNAPATERTRIVAGCRALVEMHAALGLGDGAEAGMTSQGLLAGRDRDPSDRIAVLLVEQALRLASLVHDLGHLPFSHDFEVALEDHARSHPGQLSGLLGPGRAIHERVGYALAAVVQRSIFAQRLAGTPLGKPAEVALLIARDILDAPEVPDPDAAEPAPVLSWLHTLVAGEVDVDRTDYVLRDVRHYGMIGAGFDVDRLVGNLTPVAVEDGRLETTLHSHGVTAAEAFFVARFRMYTTAVYHHKIQQAAAGLRVAIGDLLSTGGDEVTTFLADIGAIAGGRASEAAVERFVDYDDAWWTGLLRARLREGANPMVEPWLALFTRRRPGPVSLWKRPWDFPVPDRAAWNARLPHHGDEAWEEVRAGLRADGILLERFGFAPWEADAQGESILRVRTHDGLVPLTRLSSLTAVLAPAWGEALQVLAFADRPGRATPREVLERLEPALR
jgi:HD superfamily phosphohydrolase